ncbi:UDP-glucose 4-epimerase GalE [Pseudoclavibacter chungangensis]|uniref:UDP-glucose 4-epimerase n=1 Tax=Pseudoclavibacter chungangensis TaxID=587635 RepID=A0A7J5BYR5_9MICO|nr:UDP-glucose 4-epimerase GalE [Pseudoclavibacter chungangensis]KAB1659482.1 UDP-glucose 4-epimerase GalE [Pseudoclavibacter chungangensis]NYJ67660.1 UDP-glucose 4-epimerase [Pseudoclavibacter chungangensis]
MTVLVIGGAGYIGSHVVTQLLDEGSALAAVDDLSTGVAERIAGIPTLGIDVASDRAPAEMARFMRAHDVDAVIHFAALKRVPESVAEPARYYRQNVGGLANVIEAMTEAGVRRLVFSSSAAVYGQGTGAPAREDDALRPINPYGETKLVGEWLVADAVRAGVLDAVCLRYFNVAGARDALRADRFAQNLVPMIIERLRRGEGARIFGDDYATSDGTCVRDYIHVVDLADAHLRVLDALADGRTVPAALNVGTGRGYSVREVIDAVARVSGIAIEPVVEPRRAGDPADLIADARLITESLGWHARHDLDDMVESAWRFAGELTA